MKDVVQTVVRCDDEYLIGHRTADGYWEFLGGKVEEDETLKQAALRELKEETGTKINKENIEVYREGSSYKSKRDSKYRLNPVLIDLNEKISVHLSSEHSNYKWIDLEEFHSYETLGQIQALENLDIINGDVSIAVVEREDSGLLVLKRSEENTSSGYWNFPGGKIEEEEEKEEAVLRELKEETSLQGEVKKSGEYFIGSGETGHWRVYPFLIDATGKVELNHEHSDHKWSDLENIEELKTLGTGTATEILKLND